MKRYYWLSFADETGFLGACVVPVSMGDIALAKKHYPHGTECGDPNCTSSHTVDHNLIAAIMVSKQFGCNPGGEVLSGEIPAEEAKKYPILKLMNESEVIALGAVKMNEQEH